MVKHYICTLLDFSDIIFSAKEDNAIFLDL